MSENLELKISVQGADKSEKALSSLEKTLVSIDTTLSKLNTSAFDSLANSLNKLNGIKISTTVAKNIGKISEALSKLNTDGGNFEKLANGIEKLNGVKVSKTIGTGLESITNSLNNISKVKPINPQLATNLDILGRSMQGFVGLNGIQFTGIAKLTSTLAQTGKVKAFDDKIIRNAEKLGQAINKLDKDVSASNPRLEALAKIAKQIAPAMREADKGTSSFGKSLRLLNFDAILNVLDRAVKKLKEFTLMLKGIAFESGGLENSLSFFNQSLGTYARREMEILNKYAQIGAIDLKDATQQIAGMNQMLIGYGHNADNAAKMSRVLYQIAVDASFAIGENGRDVADKMKQLESTMAGLPKSLYGWGVDTSVANIIENFDEATRGMTKFTKSIYTYQMILSSTRGMQGQFAREFALATTQMYMLENQTKMTVQAIGFAIKPMFLQIVKWAFVTLRVIDLVIEALSELFGFDYQKVDYMTLLNGMNEVTSASDNIGAGAVENLDKAQKEAKKLKKYLAGFDTLNVMEIPTSSGSAVGGAIGGGIGSFVPEDYDLLGGLGDEMENYFKELDAQAEKVFEALKKILPIVALIGAGLLAWKVSKEVLDILSKLSLLKMSGFKIPLNFIIGGALFGIGLIGFIDGIRRALKDGLSEISFAEIVLSALIGTGGLALIGKGIAGAVGATIAAGIGGIIFGIPMYFVGIKDAIVNSLNWMNGILIPLGSTMAGAGIGAIIGSLGGPIGAGIGALIGLAVGLITDLVILIVQEWDVIVLFFKETWDKITTFFKDAWEEIKTVFAPVSEWFSKNVIEPIGEFFTGLWNNITEMAGNAWEGIKTFFSPAIEWFSTLFNSVYDTVSDIFYNIGVIAGGTWEIIKKVWEIVSEWFSKNVTKPIGKFFTGLWNNITEMANKAWEGIKNTFSPMFTWFLEMIIQPLGKFFGDLWTGFSDKAKVAWEAVKKTFSTVASFFEKTFRNAWQGIVKVFSVGGEIFTNIKDGILSGFKVVVNGLIKGLNNVVAIPFRGINSALNTIKNIDILGISPFSGLREISIPQIPYLAKGGIVDKATLAMIGESGKEAVVPLENNLGWINKLAKQISNKMGDNNFSILIPIIEKLVEACQNIAKSISDRNSNMTIIPAYADGNMTSNIANSYNYTNDSADVISAIKQDGYNRDEVMYELIDAITNSETVVELDGRTLGKFIRDTVNGRTERAGKTVFRT